MKSIITVLLMCALGASMPAFAEPDFETQLQAYERAIGNGDRKEAARLARWLYDHGADEFGPESEEVAGLALNLGTALDSTGELADAREMLQEARKRYRAIDKKHAQLVEVHLALGRSWSKEWQMDSKARSEYARAINLAESIYGKNSVEKAQVELRVGANLLEKDRSPRAGKYLESAWETLEAELGDTHQETGEAAFYLGKYALSDNEPGEAETWFNRALAAFIADPDAPPELEMTSRAFLVEALERQGKGDEATAHCLAIGRMSPSNPDQQRQPLFKPRLDAVSILRNSPVTRDLLAEHGGKGAIAFEFTVDEMGFVREPRVIENNLGDEFEKAGLETIAAFRYAPRFENGEPVTSTDSYRLSFEVTRDVRR